ncbi:hypothetical protein ElyMa_002807400 [Elysia marginata]|uniref:EF-hand domain-containing protein n=1 Tax=Elysia marginata TaxID=1093978 RepID=A0AAV4HQA9_9GAST|nr:hypothetical protein ElyMa_002807400 [Elysia marginata]
MDVSEFSAFNMERYRVNSSIAKVMFDLADVNGDHKLNERDWEFHFKDNFALSLCDARRSILDLARMAGKFQQSQLTVCIKIVLVVTVTVVVTLVIGRALRAAFQRKLQEEWAWYQRRQGGGGWGRFSGRGRTEGAISQQGTCNAEDLCYNGEYTQAWGRPTAWMWWGMKESDRPGFSPGGLPGSRFPGQAAGGQSGVGNMFPGAASGGLGGMGMPFIPPHSNPLLGGSGPFGQFQFPNLPAGSDAGIDDGMMSQFMPFKRNALANSADPDSSPSPKREMAENYFTHYQKLFTPFVPAEKTTKEIHESSSTSVTSANNVQGQPPTESNIFEPPKEDSRSEPSSTQEKITTSGTLAPSPETPSSSFTEGKSDSDSNGFEEIGDEVTSQEEFPFMDYPVFIGFDPWLLGASPAWGMVGRMKRRGDEELEGSEKITDDGKVSLDLGLSKEARFRRDVSSSKGEKSTIPSIPSIPSTPSIPFSDSDGAENGEDVQSNSTDFNGFGDLDPGAWPGMVGPGGPPMTFGVSPIDFWTAIMLENAMLSGAGWNEDNEWLTNQNETMQDRNETETDGQHWWLPEFWSSPGFSDGASHIDGEEEDQEGNSAQSQDEAKARSKRFAGPNMYPGFYLPHYVNPSYSMRMRMMSNMMRYGRFNPIFSRMMFRYPWKFRYPYMRRYSYRSPYFYPRTYWMKRGTVNPMLRRHPEAAKVASDSRVKREVNESPRSKRWQDYGWYPGENSNWWNRLGGMSQMYQRPNYWSNNWMGNGFGEFVWKREAEEEGKNQRSKREADKNNREKRWEKMMWLPMRYISAHWKRFTDWKGWDLINPLNRLPLGTMMNKAGNEFLWKRDAQKDDKVEKVKREAGDESREKRWQSNPMFPNWYDWNNWQSYNQHGRFRPMSQSMFNRMKKPWNTFWKRDSMGQMSSIRSKRDSEDIDRNKRWQDNFRYPQAYGSYGWPRADHSNNWQSRGWGMNQWYRRWPGAGNWDSFWKRDTEEKEEVARSKRDTNMDDRKKRWYSNTWYSEPYGRNRWQQSYSGWHDNRWGMFGGYNQMPGAYNYRNGWNGYWKRGATDEHTDISDKRQKRDAENEDVYKIKRSNMMWNYRSPYWNRWPSHMYSPYNRWQTNQWQTPYFSMWKRNTNKDYENLRTKRDTEAGSRKRRFGIVWNIRPPYWNRWAWPWFSPYYYKMYMFQRFYNHMPNWFTNGGRMWKRSIDDEASVPLRSKREIKEASREKRYRMRSGMYPQWSRWSDNRNQLFNDRWTPYGAARSWSDYGMPGNFMWRREADEKQDNSRFERSAEAVDRKRRYGMMMGSGSNFWNGLWNYPNNQWQMRQWWDPSSFGNYMWKRNSENDSEKPRIRRDTENTSRPKRFGLMAYSGWPWQWGAQSGSWQWWTPYDNIPYGNNFWKRDLEENSEDGRTKRDTGETSRSKRFGMRRIFRSPYWNRWSWQRYFPYYNWWYDNWRHYRGMPSWFNKGNSVWKRGTQVETESSRMKRDAPDENREKRMSWNSAGPYTNMWSASPSHDWYMNQRWQTYRGMPNRFNFGNQLLKRETETDPNENRAKRESEAGDREKRNWMSWNNQAPRWNRGYQNFPSAYQYPFWQNYNSGQHWSDYSNYMWKRGTEHDNAEHRTKRDADESTREKRYGNYWNRWHSPYNNWYMNQEWNMYSHMPYSFRQMWKRNSDGSEESRTKRDADNTDRAKRQYMGGNSNWPWQNRWSWGGYSPSSSWQGNGFWNQFNGMPWSSYGGQFWKRGAENTSDKSRTKRDTDETTREKRYGMMASPYWGNWNSQNMYHSWSRPHYMSQWYDYGYPMWKRNIDENTEKARAKRDADHFNKEKRHSNMWNFGWPWQWSSPQYPNYMHRRWNPHYRRENFAVSGSHMSKRGSQVDTKNTRNKRETSDTERSKRYGMMGNYGLPQQWSNPHGDWNMYQTWQPYNAISSWYGRGNYMWKRDNGENQEKSRPKRDAGTVNRSRRFGMMWSPMNNLNMPWQWFNSWYPYYFSNWFGYGNYKRKRNIEDDSTETRAKRETVAVSKEKRQGMMGNPLSRSWDGRHWQWSYPSSDWQMGRWNPFHEGPRWFKNAHSMFKRDTEDDSGESRTVREASDTNRDKRYGRGWYSRPQFWNDWNWQSPSNNWNYYNGMPGWSNSGPWRGGMWKRSKQSKIEKSRSKRDADDENRGKRYTTMWNTRAPYRNAWSWQRYNPSNQWYMPNWFGGNQFWKRDIQDNLENIRIKREAAESDKVKRQGMMYPFRSPAWGGRSSQWFYPDNNWNMNQHWNFYNNFPSSWGYSMSGGWKRDAQEAPENTRNKRDADETDRTKRRGGMMWGSWPWQWQSSFMNWRRPNFFDGDNWGYHMWKREGNEDFTGSRGERDTSALNKNKWIANMKGNTKAGTDKRQFSFNKNTSPTSKPMNSEESVWRSAKKKYGEERTWQRRLNQGNSKWHHGSNKNYGFTTNKWADGAAPNAYRTSTGSWMQTPNSGKGYSWQSTPSSFPVGGFNRAGGMASNRMDTGGWYGGMLGGNGYDQPYANQWRGVFNRDGSQGMNNYWPMEGAFSPYGMYGLSPMGMRYFREAQTKRETQELESAESGTGSSGDEEASHLHRKRDTVNDEKVLDRKKRFSNFFNGYASNPMRNMYRYYRMRQMWAPWFFYSFCQRPPWWGSRAMGLYKRNATNTDKDNAFFNTKTQTPSAQWLDSEKEKRQGRFYNNGGYGNRFFGQNAQWGRNRNQNWQYYNWMCPQAWNIMQRNFRSPSNFFPNFNGFNLFNGMRNPYFYNLRQQNRWKRSSSEGNMAANPRSPDDGGYDDVRGRRQWGNFWRGWPRGHALEDCEEWASPMPAWSPWRGWNMLRKNRETSADEDRVKRESETSNLSDDEEDDRLKGKRAAHRCRNWQGRNFNNPNMDMSMAMGNRMQANRFGMDSWRNSWMDGNRWSSRRYRRDAASKHDVSDDVGSSGREKRWQPDMWYYGFGPQRFWPGNSFNPWNQW